MQADVYQYDRVVAGEIDGYSMDKRFIRQDGDVVYASISVSCLRREDGSVDHFVALVSDISERKQAETLLRESERKSRAWLENSPICTKIVDVGDMGFNLQYMSSAGIDGLKIPDISRYYGTPSPLGFYPEAFRTLMTDCLERARDTGVTGMVEGSVADMEGNDLWFHSTVIPSNSSRPTWSWSPSPIRSPTI